MTLKSTEANLEHTAAADQLAARKELLRLFKKAPMSEADLAFNLGLYVRSGLLVKFILMADLYRRFMRVPGIIVEAGTWFGQNAVLFENCRALFEPFNKDRRVVLFDTFEGYRESKFAGTGMYSTGKKYVDYLDNLLSCHAQMNVYGHIPSGHEIVEGDVCATAPAYFQAHQEVTVAFACIDIGPYHPTYAALKAMKPHLVSGSMILLDEFTLRDMPGEAIAFKRLFARGEYDIERCALYPSKSVVTIR